jgi:FixJ family two-component response regulator
MNKAKSTIYIIEDDASFRKSIERLIRASGFEAVSFESANSFMAATHLRHPACILLDMRLPDINGLDLQQKLIERDDGLPIIFMTGHGSIPMSVQAMKKGAVDFLPKPFEAKDLLSAVVISLERDIQSRKKEIQLHKIESIVDTLTPREKEVMSWVITGKLNKQIALAMGISEKTVKVHRSRIMQKTGVISVAELVHMADKANILPAR